VRRPLEIALVVVALVGLPLGVVVVARSQPPSFTSATARAVLAPVIGTTTAGGGQLQPVDCRWSRDHTSVTCRVAGGGSCHFKADGAGTCSGGGNPSWQIVVLVGSDHRRP
jgi:hypothetical protein